MKKLYILGGIALLLALSGFAYQPEIDYMAQMLDAATVGDYEAGEAAQEHRAAKIDALGLQNPKVAFEDLYLLAKIAQAEAGDVPGDAGNDVCQGIMEVVMNRVGSPEFPDNIKDVLYQRGQYYVGSRSYDYFEGVRPTKRVLEIALRVLEGERVMTPDVVYHGNAPMFGGEAHKVSMGPFGIMYFSYSQYQELYSAEE